MTSTDWMIFAILLPLLLYIVISRFQSPQPNAVHLATGLFILIVGACCLASGHIPTQYRDSIDRSKNPLFFWIFILGCGGSGLTHIAKFVFRHLGTRR